MSVPDSRPDYIRFGRLYPFTKDPRFSEWLEEAFDFVRGQVQTDQTRYSQDWVSGGLTSLANAVQRKASRIYDLAVIGLPGKDKIEDEYQDMLMTAFYNYIYWKVLRDKHDNQESNGPGSGQDTEVRESIRSPYDLPEVQGYD